MTKRLIFAIIAMLPVTINSLSAQDRTWNGPAGGDWFSASNWLPDDNYPQAGESVAIPSGTSVLLTNSTAGLGAVSITNATLIFTNWHTALVATNVTVENNGILTLPAPFTDADMSNRVYVVCSNFTLQAGGQIQADGRGYADQNGPGTTASTGTGVSGSGHGGRGGVGATFAAGGVIYGEAHAPLYPGSGAPPYANSASYKGHHGGGAVFIDATGTVIINGLVSANAGRVTSPNPVNYAGGGSGGSIYIRCQQFGGTTNGSLRANGGKAGSVGGAGAGGRIAVDYQSLSGTPGVRMSANRGQGAWRVYDINAAFEDYAAQLGTLWFPDPDFLNAARTAWAGNGLSGFGGYVIFDSTNVWMPSDLTLQGSALGIPNGDRWEVAGDLVMNASELWIPVHAGFDGVGNFTLTNSSFLIVYSAQTNASRPIYGQRIGVTNTMTVASGCWVYPYSDGTNGGSVFFDVGALHVMDGGGFNADGRGYGGTHGLSTPGLHAGAGYGGKGGHGSTTAAGGLPYGSTNAPVYPGSAAGRYGTAYPYSHGGGLIRIEAAGNVNVDGTLTANGFRPSPSPSNYGRGGSGGGIFILCDTFGGALSGLIRANGGAGGSSAGGGGGGRISIGIGLSDLERQQLLAGNAVAGLTSYYQHVPYSGTLSATNGAGRYTDDEKRADPGTAQFMHIVSASDRTVVITGNPAQYGSPSPETYGAWIFSQGTVVTSRMTSPTGESNGLRRASIGWRLTDTALGTPIASGSSTQAVFTVTDNVTLTWLWTNEYYLGFSADDNGDVNSDTLGGWYTNGTEVSGLLATPDFGYYFAGWLGEDLPPVQNADNPVSVIMDQPRTNITGFFASPAAQTRIWTGAANWLTPANWSPAGIPGSNDTLIIESGQTLLSVATAVRDVQVNAGASIVFSNWNTCLAVAFSVAIMSNGLVTLTGPFMESGMSNRVWITCQDFNLHAGGLIDANERGFANDNGPGKGIFGVGSSGSGHGGRGGDGNSRAGGPIYGVSNAPVAPGSGGIRYGTSYGRPHGGGVVRVDARETMLINGTIRANGGFLGAASPVNYGCGASGGSLFLSAVKFSGSSNAVLEARGGNGGSSAGGGGGGRIAIWQGVTADRVAGVMNGSDMRRVEISGTSENYDGSLSVAGGTAFNNGEDGSVVFLTLPPAQGMMILVR